MFYNIQVQVRDDIVSAALGGEEITDNQTPTDDNTSYRTTGDIYLEVNSDPANIPAFNSLGIFPELSDLDNACYGANYGQASPSPVDQSASLTPVDPGSGVEQSNQSMLESSQCELSNQQFINQFFNTTMKHINSLNKSPSSSLLGLLGTSADEISLNESDSKLDLESLDNDLEGVAEDQILSQCLQRSKKARLNEENRISKEVERKELSHQCSSKNVVQVSTPLISTPKKTKKVSKPTPIKKGYL